MYTRLSVNHNSLGCEQPPGLDVNQSLSVHWQDVFRPIPGGHYISIKSTHNDVSLLSIYNVHAVPLPHLLQLFLQEKLIFAQLKCGGKYHRRAGTYTHQTEAKVQSCEPVYMYCIYSHVKRGEGK